MRHLVSKIQRDAGDAPGFGCSACAWFFAIESQKLDHQPPPSITVIVVAFHAHKCDDFVDAA